MKTVFNTAMVAHVWAQGTQSSGRNSGRRVFFEGPRIYSYGYHFLSGYRCPDGSAFITSDRYSVSTAGHVADARRAVTGAVYLCPDLKALAETLDSSVFNVPQFGRGVYPVQYAPATAAELKAARKRLAALFLNAKETAPADTIAAAFRYAGASETEAARLADQISAKRAKAAAKAKAAADTATIAGQLQDAKAAAARPVSDFEGVAAKARARVRHESSDWATNFETAGLLDKAKRLRLARLAARSKGWGRIATALMIRECLLRAVAASLPAVQLTARRLSFWQERVAIVRRAKSDLANNVKRKGGYDWQVSRQSVESLVGALGEDWTRPYAGIVGANRETMAAALGELVEALKGAESRAYALGTRAARRADLAALKAWKAAGAGASLEVIQAAGKAAGKYAKSAYYVPAVPGAFALAGFTGEAFANLKGEAMAAIEALKERAKTERVTLWRQGLLPRNGSEGLDAQGGALLRAVGVERDDSGAITGGELQTSQGASVPLAHALRAFRFLKLCRDSGTPWKANGKTLPVGHFRIESVSAQGDFVAGCHKINWGEVAALALSLGVDSLAAADTTEPREGVHA